MGDRLAGWFESVAGRLFGPVFVLEATRVGRRPLTFIVRWVYLLILLGVLWVVYHSWQPPASASAVVEVDDKTVLSWFAENFFWVYAITQFVAVALITPAFTAAAITDEKERKTLDFLLITDLTGREIVFGKLAARVGVLVMFVLAGLPVVALMQFFGGIEPRLLFLTFIMTLVTVLSLSAVSVAVSVLMSRTRDAVILAYAIPAVYLSLSFQLHDPARPGMRALTGGNPYLAAQSIDQSFGNADMPPETVWYIAFQVVVAVLGFTLAAVWLRKSGEGKSTHVGQPRGIFGRFVAWLCDRRTEARRHPPVSDEPVRWREVYVDPGGGGGLMRRLFLLALLAGIIGPLLWIAGDAIWYYDIYSRGNSWSHTRGWIQIWVCAVTGALGSVMILRATIRGAASVAGERDRDTWVSLQTTPLTAREILSGKWAGCVWGQRGMIYLLAVVWFIGVVTVSVNAFVVAMAAASLGVYLYSFAWLGIRISVTAPNSRVAISRAVPAAVFLGGGYWFFLSGCGFVLIPGANRDGIDLIRAFFAALTPPVVLAGFPAIDRELLGIYGPDVALTAAVSCAGVVGIAGWVLLGNLWYWHAHALAKARTIPSPREWSVR